MKSVTDCKLVVCPTHSGGSILHYVYRNAAVSISKFSESKEVISLSCFYIVFFFPICEAWLLFFHIFKKLFFSITCCFAIKSVTQRLLRVYIFIQQILLFFFLPTHLSHSFPFFLSTFCSNLGIKLSSLKMESWLFSITLSTFLPSSWLICMKPCHARTLFSCSWLSNTVTVSFPVTTVWFYENFSHDEALQTK